MKKRFLGIPLVAILIAVLLVGVVSAAALLLLVKSNDVTVNVVAKPSYSITISAPSEIYSGEAFTVTGTLSSGNGAPVNGKTISLFKGTDFQPGTVTTDASGNFSKDVWGMDSPNTGSLTVHAEFQP